MAKDIERISFFEGENNSFNDLAIPSSEMQLAVNVDTGQKPGAFRLRPGTAVEGDEVQDGKQCLGLFYYKKGTTSKFVVATNDSAGTDIQLKYNDSAGGNWSTVTITNLWNGSAGNFESDETDPTIATMVLSGAVLVDSLFMVGYDSTDDVFIPTGEFITDTLTTSGNSLGANSPTGAKFCLVYQDRLFVLNTYETTTRYPSRVRWSDTPSSSTIAWTAASYVDIYEKDGEEITGGAVNDDLLYIFKETYVEIRRFSGTSLIRVGRIEDIGATSFRSIIVHKGYIYVLNSEGIYRIKGSSHEKISNAVNEVFDAMGSTNWNNAVAWVEDDKIKFYVGTVSNIGISKRTLTRGVLVYDTKTQKWCEYEMAGAVGYACKKGKVAYSGTDDGWIHQSSNTTYTDDDEGVSGSSLLPINIQIKTHPLVSKYGWEFIKDYKKIYARANDWAGLAVNYYIDKSDKPIRVGSLKDRINFWPFAKRGREIEIEVVGNVKHSFELNQISVIFEAKDINVK